MLDCPVNYFAKALLNCKSIGVVGTRCSSNVSPNGKMQWMLIRSGIQWLFLVVFAAITTE